MADDLFDPKDDEGGGGDVDSGDVDSGDIEFNDSEAEVFDVTEIDFDDEDTDVETFYAQVEDEKQKAKASCNASSVEANKNSSILWVVAAGSGLSGALATVAVAAGLGAATQSYMGAMAQECANDPARPDTNVVSKFRRLPIRPLREGFKEYAPHYAVAATSLQVAAVLAAFRASVERFDGARAALKAGEDGARQHVFLQASAVTYNAQVAGLQFAWLTTAITNLRRRLGPLESEAAKISEMTATEVADAVESAGQLALGAFDPQRTPQALRHVEVQVQGFATAIREGAVTPTSLAASVLEDRIAATAIDNTGTSLQSLASAFIHAGDPHA